MIPRGRPDIGWSDLLAGLFYCLYPRRDPPAIDWPAPGAITVLSVRSGLDLLLQAMCWPAGSEVLMSGVTIPDMMAIVRGHGFVPVAVDIDPRTLATDPSELARRASDRTRGVLIAPLFGSRSSLEKIGSLAKDRGWFLIEDAAQAFAGRAYPGDPAADAALFSFGPIKTATALGGGLLSVREPDLRQRIVEIQSHQPTAPQLAFARRCLLFAGLKLLTTRTGYGLFCRWLRRRGRDVDDVLAGMVRGFGGEGLERFRRRPCAPLARLMLRRIEQNHAPRLAKRRSAGHSLLASVPAANRIGDLAAHHDFWVFPVRSDRPDELVAALREKGVDASRRASSLVAIDGEALGCRALTEQAVYVPLATSSAALSSALAAVEGPLDAG